MARTVTSVAKEPATGKRDSRAVKAAGDGVEKKKPKKAASKVAAGKAKPAAAAKKKPAAADAAEAKPRAVKQYTKISGQKRTMMDGALIAIKELKERNGSSVPGVLKYTLANQLVEIKDAEHARQKMSRALKKALDAGYVVQKAGHQGMSGLFRLAPTVRFNYKNEKVVSIQVQKPVEDVTDAPVPAKKAAKKSVTPKKSPVSKKSKDEKSEPSREKPSKKKAGVAKKEPAPKKSPKAAAKKVSKKASDAAADKENKKETGGKKAEKKMPAAGKPKKAVAKKGTEV